MIANGNPEAHAAPRVMTADQVIETNLGPVVSCLVNGVMVSMQMLPVELVVTGLCKLMGRALGIALQGDIVPTLQLRKQCRDAFEEGMKAVPIKTPAPMSGAANSKG